MVHNKRPDMNVMIKKTAASLPALALALLAGAANAQTPVATKAAAAETEQDSTIIVTGTRRTDRTVAESAVPIDVFTSDDLIKAQGSPNLQSILKNLIPSFNQQRNLLGDASAFVRPPTLRGLPADQILVLVNGKRMHRSALVQVTGGGLNQGAQGADLSQISGASIARVEVLRDGAAAQYGSDAIAGVINIGLRRNDSGYEFAGRYGKTYQGDGSDLQLSANAGFKLGEGFFNVTGEFIDQNVFDRSLARPEIAPLIAGGIKPKYPTGNRLGQPENRAYRFIFNSAIPVGDGEVYLFGNYGYQRQGNDFNLRRPFAVTAQDIPLRPGTGSFGKSIPTTYLDRIGTTPTGTPIWNETGRTFEASQFFPNGFVPFFEATNEDMSITGGYKGKTDFGMTFDLSGSAGRNMIRYFMSETINPSLGPDSPQSFYLGKVVQNEYNANLDLTYEADIGLVKPVVIAGGLEFRREAFEVGIGDRASYVTGQYAAQTVQRANGTTFLSTKPVGASGFPGFGPDSAVEGGRNSYSAYLDVEGDIVEGFSLGVAARYDHFNDFGSTFNGKVSARWAINEVVALRGAASTGFRAPTPGQQFTQNVQTAFPGGSPIPVAIATARPDSITAQYYLAQPLRPEKSTSFSGGFVLTPGSGFNLTVDYYNIKVRDRIGITGQFVVTAADQAQLFARGVPAAFDLGRVNDFTNGVRTKTQGVDAVLTHRAQTDLGNFNTSVAVNYNSTKVTGRRNISGTLPTGVILNQPLIDDVRKGTIEEAVPKWRAVISETYTNGMFDVTARFNYFGKYTTFFDPVAFPAAANTPALQAAFRELYPIPFSREFGAQVSVDLEAGVTFEERFRIAVGAENLFGTFPERETRNAYPSTGGQANGSQYSDFAPIGQAGGFWYVRASAKF